ncbi:flippase [Buttiauxella noackiae]|uniref:flippase n=1 Tax=Buttiauxella noackiae TaxID=82992 RepID=UPI0028D5B34B|nr:flippase [Buttiauxella noackiae]
MGLKTNSIINLAGYALPTLVSIPATGYLARKLGTDEFGIYLIFFTIIGYASIFDLGLSRAIVRDISLNRNNKEEVKNSTSTALVITLSVGVLIAICIYYYSPQISGFLSKKNDTSDIVFSVKLIALCIPFYLLTQVVWGVFEGHENFKSLNIQRTLSGIISALLPLLMIQFTSSLGYATVGLVVGRIFGAIISYTFLMRYTKVEFKLNLKKMKELLSFGGWASVSSVINPLLTNIDRLILTNLAGPAKSAFYMAPSDGISKLLIIPTTIARTIFPALCKINTTDERKAILKESYLIVSLVTFILVIPVFIFSDKLITLWLGEQFATVAPDIFRVLLIGFVFNSLAQIPFAQIQSKGLSNITATIHMIECIPYLIVLFFLIKEYSAMGAAYAWSVRVATDYFILWFVSYKTERR